MYQKTNGLHSIQNHNLEMFPGSPNQNVFFFQTDMSDMIIQLRMRLVYLNISLCMYIKIDFKV